MTTIVYTLTPQLRIKLKEPFGMFVEGSFEETMAKMKSLLETEKPSVLISVGDVVSKNLHDYGMHPQLTIIDNKSLRNQAMPPQKPVDNTVYVKNPQGAISQEAIDAVKAAIEAKRHTHIVVDGEEDLLSLIAILYAPTDAWVVYGQPHSGIVVVKALSEKKEQVKKLLKTMKDFEKLNKAKTV
jgi:uncharacterized protein (UPF0218 family)